MIFAVVLGTLGRPVWPPVVGRVADGGPAATAGLRTDDTVVAVNGRPIAYWEDLDRALSSVRRASARAEACDATGAERTMTVTPRLRSGPRSGLP